MTKVNNSTEVYVSLELEKKLHKYAREVTETLEDLDKKHLRFNDIVSTALKFYGPNPFGGVKELVESCDRNSCLYVHKSPMWKSLNENYEWMLVNPQGEAA